MTRLVLIYSSPAPDQTPMALCRCDTWVRPEPDGTCRWCGSEVKR